MSFLPDPASFPVYQSGQTMDADADTAGGGGIDAFIDAIKKLLTALGAPSNTVATLTGAIFKGYSENPLNVGTVGAAHTFDISQSTAQRGTKTTATAATFTMPPVASSAGKSFTYLDYQPATGTPAASAFAGVQWAGGIVPTSTNTLGAKDLYSFYCPDGAIWLGSVQQDVK